MKVLIAEDERVARKVLEAFLLKEKYEVVLAEDGASALKCALTFTEPYIAILDWVMPGLTGPQVCVCLRSPKLKIRPYIIVLSARTDKGDIAAVLDAGADDFLTKPFNQVELMARLRVAGRSLQYHSELRQQIVQLEALAQRYNLLGEIVAQQAGGRLTAPPMKSGSSAVQDKPAPSGAVNPFAPAAPAPVRSAGTPAGSDDFFIKPPVKGQDAPEPAPAVTPARAGITPNEDAEGTEETTGKASASLVAKEQFPPVDLSPEEADAIIQQVVAELGFGKIGVMATVHSDMYKAPEFSAWAGLILEREQVWIDLLLEVDAAAMAMIFEQTLGRRPGSDQERENFLAETHTIVSTAFKSALINKGALVMTPALSRVKHTKDREVPVPSKCEMHRYVLAGGSIGLTVVRYECPLRKKSTNRLRSSDIMADAYPPPTIHENVLLNKGTVLTGRFIEKLVALEEEQDEKLAIPVYSASPLAIYFMTER